MGSIPPQASLRLRFSGGPWWQYGKEIPADISTPFPLDDDSGVPTPTGWLQGPSLPDYEAHVRGTKPFTKEQLNWVMNNAACRTTLAMTIATLLNRCVASIRGFEEFLEPLGEARGSRDEVPGAGRDEPLGVQLPGEGVANPLECLRVVA